MYLTLTAVLSALKKLEGMSFRNGARVSVREVDFSRLRFEDQVAVDATSDVLVGPFHVTLLVKAVACSSGASFVSLAAADVYSPLVGDAEQAVRRSFDLARRSPPALLFFDELDTLLVNRGTGEAGGSGSGSGSVESRVLSTFLNEMDGIVGSGDGSDGLLVVAATNRPASLDAALLRPGRFEAAVHIPAPDNAARLAIFSVHLDKVPLGGDVDLAFLAKITDGFTGAEVAGVCREAAFEAMRAAADEADEAEASGKANAGAGTGAGGSAEGSGGGGESSRSNSEVSLREHLGSVVIRMQHLEAAAAATVPLLSDQAKRVLYAADFSLD